MDDDTAALRARDFWAAIVLFALSLFFLWKTSAIPLFGAERSGIGGSEWYTSAAVVPLGLFGALLVLSLVLLTIAIRTGGATQALSAAGLGWDGSEALRFVTIGVIITAYVVGLVPRVDFMISSGLLITALIYGYRGGHAYRAVIAAAFVSAAGIFALALHLPQAEWNLHGDDWFALLCWVSLTAVVLGAKKDDRVARIIPIIAIVAPLILVTVMAFGFRQNVPARGGLIFKQIEYHYFVTLKPVWNR